MELLQEIAPLLMTAGLALMALAVYYAVTVVGGGQAKLCLIAGGICLGAAAALSDIKAAEQQRRNGQTAQSPQYGQPGNYGNQNTGGAVNQNGNAGQINSNSPQRLPPGTYLIDGQIVVVANTTSTGTSNGLAVESGASSTMVSR